MEKKSPWSGWQDLPIFVDGLLSWTHYLIPQNMENNVGIVFLHGAGLGSWIYDDVAPLVKYPALSLNFPNRQADANASLTLEDYYRPMVQKIKDWTPKKIIVVAHSISGIIGLKITEHIADRLVGFVAISAVIPSKGGSFVSCLPFPKNILLGFMIRLVGTKPPRGAIVHGLCNDLTKDQTEKVLENFTTESKFLFIENTSTKIPLTNSLYIKTTRDNEMPITLQDRFAKNLKAQHIVSINSGHLPMLSQPGELSRILHEFVRTA